MPVSVCLAVCVCVCVLCVICFCLTQVHEICLYLTIGYFGKIEIVSAQLEEEMEKGGVMGPAAFRT